MTRQALNPVMSAVAGAIGALAASTITKARPDGGIFDAGTQKAARLVVTVGPALPDVEPDAPPMLRALRGVLADLKARDQQPLRDCTPRNPFVGDPTGGERVCVVQVLGAARAGAPAAPFRTLEIVRTPDGGYVAQELDAAGTASARGARAELLRDPFAAASLPWPAYRGAFTDDAAEPRGEVLEVKPPYVPSPFTLDKAAIGARFLGGATPSLDGAKRDLTKEHFWARLPKGCSAREPAGLLVWVDAGDSGKPPEPLRAALDELGIICIGAAESGNGRVVSERYQLALDAAATAMRRWHVDPRRVYVSGISGGGRVASMLQACFPDVFTGCVAIVGMNCYQNVPDGMGGFYRAGYAKPRSEQFKMFKQRRMAAITGLDDANCNEIQNAARILNRDGATVKVFQYADMGHTMPTPARFTEAIRWVDEPWRQARTAERDAAAKAWEAYTQRFAEKQPDAPSARKMLERVIEAGPWTPEAWKACALLGVTGEAASARKQDP